MDPDGEEIGEFQGVVSDHEAEAEVDATPLGQQQQQQQQQQHEEAIDANGGEWQDHGLQQFSRNDAFQWQRQQQQQQLALAYHHYPADHPVEQTAGPWVPPPPASQDALAMAQYYEARMRSHAAAYASAAASMAAWAAEFAANAHANSLMPPALPPAPPPMPQGQIFYPPPDNNNNNNNNDGTHPPALPLMGTAEDLSYSHNAGDLYYEENSNNDFDDSRFQQQQQQHYLSSSRSRRMYPENEEDVETKRSWHQEINSGGNSNDESYLCHNNRKKRFQRRPPGGIVTISRQRDSGSNNSTINQNNSRVRRRLRDGGDSSNSSCCSGSLGTSINSYSSDQPMGGNNSNTHSSSRCPINSSKNKYANNRGSGSSGGRGGTSYHRSKKKQRQPPDDSSLLGKTAIAALYEFCNKRRMAEPKFGLMEKKDGHFEIAVTLEDGFEYGRGKGTTQKSAKHDAARKALYSLLPGVVFDPMRGILLELPGTSNNNHRHDDTATASASLEDLAPHLEQRLAIGTGNIHGGGDGDSSSAGERVGSSSNKLKRTWNVYPGTTSTGTSEEEDENVWYSSRGASVVSVLLHALVHIDDRILEPPQYSYELSEPPTTNAQMKRKDPASSCNSSAIVVHRGSYSCTATLKVAVGSVSSTSGNCRDIEESDEATIAKTAKTEEAPCVLSSSAEDSMTKNEEAGLEKNRNDEETNLQAKLGGTECELQLKEKEKGLSYTVLEVVAVGELKRDSRHIANAKLLAKLFPECQTMVEVKKAAEAVRERHVSSKAKKMAAKNAKRGFTRRSGRGHRSKIPRISVSRLNMYATCDDPPLLANVAQQLQEFVLKPESSKLATMCIEVANFERLNLNTETTSSSFESGKRKQGVVQDSICRQQARQRQLEVQVDNALQALNEHDEEGRSLPGEITVDDVGRTVLRRAESEDLGMIRKLLGNEDGSEFCSGTRMSPGTAATVAKSPVSVLGTAAISDIWSSSTIVLLLCRKAAQEDPPLGCAVLNLGFSMRKGKLLRIAQIGLQSHLPRERFLECLEGFSSCMGCAFERKDNTQESKSNSSGIRLRCTDLKMVVESHLGANDFVASGEAKMPTSSPLQSVLEESEKSGDDSEKSKDILEKSKELDKPSKRSRVE